MDTRQPSSQPASPERERHAAGPSWQSSSGDSQRNVNSPSLTRQDSRSDERRPDSSALRRRPGGRMDKAFEGGRAPSSYFRRASSLRGPHKREVFSVDDAQEEIGDAAQRARYASGALRRPGSSIRRRTTTNRLPVLDTNESEETLHDDILANSQPSIQDEPVEEHEEIESAEEMEGESPDGVEDDDNVSDAGSFTLRDRQQAINETHPFGIRIWKPALYKKSRSVEKGAEGDIHSTPGQMVNNWLWIGNLLWTLLFGWWLAAVAAVGAMLCQLLAFAPGCQEYGRTLWGFATYIFYPFGKYVKLVQDDAYVQEDEGQGRPVAEYEQWQSGDIEEGRLFFGPVRSLIGRRREEVDSEDENDPLLSRGRTERADSSSTKPKRRLFGRGQWNVGRVIFFVVFYGLLTPLLFLVSAICWLLIFTVPMARVSWILMYHLRHRPLSLEFHADSARRQSGTATSSIILCTYRAVGLKYWKYTVEGTNIILINLLSVVIFVIADYWILYVALGLDIWLTNSFFIFLLALFSVIPLAYFIGQAVASISAQSTMGVGAVVNAFFSTIVEVFLYCIALKEGKGQLVEGSIVGSIFAGILLLPGLSMCFGAVKRKTQRFNVKSAGVTTTMLLFAVIGAFGPTLFYQIYGAHELNCQECKTQSDQMLDRNCKRCFFAQIPAVRDPFYVKVIRPYCWFAAVALFLSYIVGLLFTLRTHAATIWNMEIDEKKADKMDNRVGRQRSLDYTMTPRLGPKPDIRESNLYKKILGQSLSQAGLTSPMIQPERTLSRPASNPSLADSAQLPDGIATTDYGTIKRTQPQLHIKGLSTEESRSIVVQMAEMAATAATVAARDATREVVHGRDRPAKPPIAHRSTATHSLAGQEILTTEEAVAAVAAGAEVSGGHDAPNWSRTKSFVVLLTATVAYAVIAEILVSTVDAVLGSYSIDEKFLGITLFALVPNTTEFLNAISFAMNGNIALSMEIGSAYALQVCLLQVPALVLFSAVYISTQWNNLSSREIEDHAFTLIFPQWDMVTTILCVFLLAYMYGEGKSNYFKGSILILSYLVVVVGFYLASFTEMDILDPNEPDFSATGSVYRRSRGQSSVFILH